MKRLLFTITLLLFAAGTCFAQSVALKWTPGAVTSTNPAATSYNVLRSTATGSAGAVMGNATGTSYTDTTNLVPGTTYYYVVQGEISWTCAAPSTSCQCPNSSTTYAVGAVFTCYSVNSNTVTATIPIVTVTVSPAPSAPTLSTGSITSGASLSVTVNTK